MPVTVLLAAGAVLAATHRVTASRHATHSSALASSLDVHDLHAVAHAPHALAAGDIAVKMAATVVA